MVVPFTLLVINIYHAVEPPRAIDFVCCFPMIGCSLRVLRLPPPLKLVAMI
jgi:hypothetical protein